MMKSLATALLAATLGLLSFPAGAATRIESVKVVGDRQADVVFALTSDGDAPTVRINDNIAELTFAGAELNSALGEKVEMVAPHALINRISVYVPEPKMVRARIAINGSTEGLKNRISVTPGKNAIQVSVQFPRGENATLSLLKEEQQPIVQPAADAKKASGFGATGIVIITLMFAFAAAACFFFVRFLQKKSGVKGPRKFLIENLSYCALNQKAGVSLLKIGTEFVLVGVTPENVTFLSALPKLQTQYEEESSFERTNFRQAVKEEFERINPRSNG